MRRLFLIVGLSGFALAGLIAYHNPALSWLSALLIAVLALGFYDLFQRRHAIKRNFPLLGRFRYLFEMIRPEINQYFVESNTDGRPFSREQRSIVYQRAKCELDTLPFGTQRDVYEPGYEWVNHSLAPCHIDPCTLRVTIGSKSCSQPYDASILNVSAMSFGSLSAQAVRALNRGAKHGRFAHNTGEGGMTEYHREGGDLIWQLGTGYFGARTKEGRFCSATFADQSQRPEVKMIEIKLSQGAKPGHGGILPGRKVNAEIARVRGVPLGEDIISPPAHSAFSTPIELLEFVQKLRDSSSGKPVGLKLCVGKRREFFAICKAMTTTGITPDFVTVDGGEGGTGAAPLEFSNSIGVPLYDGLIFVHNALRGFALRNDVRIIASGGVITGFDIVKRLAIGADLCSSARGMMFALGCIQALRCNNNSCPTGITTQDPQLVAGLVVSDKEHRIHHYHRETLESVADIVGTMGLNTLDGLRPWHILRRINITEVRNYSQLYTYIDSGALLGTAVPPHLEQALCASDPSTFLTKAQH